MVFGQNSGVKSTIHSVKGMDLQVTEVIITAYEQSRGRVPALTLFKFLNQPEKMNLLRSSLQCVKIFPLVAFSKADREKYLNSPPEGFDPNLWKQVCKMTLKIYIIFRECALILIPNALFLRQSMDSKS